MSVWWTLWRRRILWTIHHSIYWALYFKTKWCKLASMLLQVPERLWKLWLWYLVWYSNKNVYCLALEEMIVQNFMKIKKVIFFCLFWYTIPTTRNQCWTGVTAMFLTLFITFAFITNFWWWSTFPKIIETI